MVERKKRGVGALEKKRGEEKKNASAGIGEWVTHPHIGVSFPARSFPFFYPLVRRRRTTKKRCVPSAMHPYPGLLLTCHEAGCASWRVGGEALCAHPGPFRLGFHCFMCFIGPRAVLVFLWCRPAHSSPPPSVYRISSRLLLGSARAYADIPAGGSYTGRKGTLGASGWQKDAEKNKKRKVGGTIGMCGQLRVKFERY